MLEFDRAQALLIGAGRVPAQSVLRPLAVAQGRVLAEPVIASVDMPTADNSAMDGYALRLADYAAGRALPIQQRCYAGVAPLPLKPGYATRLFTGSLLPEGADSIAIQEDCSESDGHVVIHAAPVPGRHVRRRAEDIGQGTVLLEAGTVLDAARIGVLAAQGCARVPVWPRLRVGVLTTGDEVIGPGQPLAAHQVYNANGPMLAALITGMGARVSRRLHAVDTVADLETALTTLAQCSDLVLTVGGVSVGEHDLVKPVLESLGGELELWKVRMKPGKPVALGRVGQVPVVGLPGNPVSAYAVFTVLVSPMLRRMQGRAMALPPTMTAVLRGPKSYGDSRENFLRVKAQSDPAGLVEVVPHTAQASGVMRALPWADGLARIPAGVELADGARVAYYPFATWLR